MFWASRQLRLRGTTFAGRGQLYSGLVQSMRFVQMQYGDALQNKAKPYLGVAEIRQLLDHEALNNRCIELSEQHQALWCIARISALRPSSLAPEVKLGRTTPLKWKDFQFFRMQEPGKFRCVLTLDHVDIKRPSDPMAAQKEQATTIPLRLNMTSPEVQNIVFSVPHRLLVIALRRAILEGIETIDDLLSSDLNEIRVKRKHLNDIVFYRGVPKGTALDTSGPLSSWSLTDYLRRRGVQIGYTETITWYSIRRRAATDMARRIGLAATRIFLGHSADSFTLERYYLNMFETLDNTAVLLEQDILPGGVSAERVQNWSELALSKLNEDAVRRTRGQALEALVNRLILADDDPPPAETSIVALKNYRRRVRAVARQILLDEESDAQKSRMTRTEMTSREKQLHASAFAKTVIEKALGAIRDNRQDNAEPDDELDIAAEAQAEAEAANCEE